MINKELKEKLEDPISHIKYLTLNHLHVLDWSITPPMILFQQHELNKIMWIE